MNLFKKNNVDVKVEKMTVCPGDLVEGAILFVNAKLISKKDAEDIKARLESIVPEGVTVFVYRDNVEIHIASPSREISKKDIW